MSETKHTPGPWKISDGAILCQNVNAYGNFHIARFDRGDSENTNEDLANARLIAAAPELLAACRRMLPWIGKMIADGAHKNSVAPLDCENAMRQAEAAIAKAEGREM